jgi:dTDP-4-amino-4,6-dideoxygalactose transaminase
MIKFNIPPVLGTEIKYIQEAIEQHKLSGNGEFTKRCHRFFEERYGFKKALLTTSCTDALEMCALLLNLKEGDEVIMPSYTFVSTANAFVLRGAKIIFVDSLPEHPNMDPKAVEEVITNRTKAIVVVHYGGVACDMEAIMNLAKRYELWVVEDAAQALEASYKGRPLGTWGHLAAFSFHETKNITSGEGGLLAINHDRFVERSEILWEKGTNRAAFYRGEADKYGWVDLGSSFLPSELNAAYLLAQLEQLDTIQQKRHHIWKRYREELNELQDQGYLQLPQLPADAQHNAHIFFLVLPSLEIRTQLMDHLRSRGIHTTFHYLSLHKSPFYHRQHDNRKLHHSDRYTDCLVRLPLHFHLSDSEVSTICWAIREFFQ